MVLDQLTDGADAAVAQVVDVVRLVFVVVDADLLPDDRDEVVLRERALLDVGVGQTLVELVAADAAEVVAARVEEEAVEQAAGVFVGGGIAGAQAAVDLKQGPGLVALFVFVRHGLLADGAVQEAVDLVGVDLFEHGAHALVRAEQGFVLDLGVGVDGAKEGGDGDLALAVDFDGEDVFAAGFEFQPGTAVGDEFGGAELAPGGGVEGGGEVDAGGAHELADDDALGTVDDEGAVAGHEGEVAEEELLLLDLARLLDHELHHDAQGRGEGHVALVALMLRVAGRDAGQEFVEVEAFDVGALEVAEAILAEDELHAVAGEVLNGGDFAEQFPQPFLQEPAIGIELEADEIGHLFQFGDAGVVLPFLGNEDARDEIDGGRGARRGGGGGGGHCGSSLLTVADTLVIDRDRSRTRPPTFGRPEGDAVSPMRWSGSAGRGRYPAARQAGRQRQPRLGTERGRVSQDFDSSSR